MPPSMEPKARLSRERDPTVERFAEALREFKEPQESELVSRKDNSIRQHPDEHIEGYFEWVTRSGIPGLAWDVIRPAFLWKVKFVMDEMMRLERSRLPDGEELDFDDKSQLKLSYDFIIEKAADFDGAPFTWQRICELLHTPSRHYKKAIKFIRALDKTINVVSTVDPNGRRLTGADWVPSPDNFKIENAFVGRVDEVDDAREDGLWGWNVKGQDGHDHAQVNGETTESDMHTEQAEPLDMSTKSRKRESQDTTPLPEPEAADDQLEDDPSAEPAPKRTKDEPSEEPTTPMDAEPSAVVSDDTSSSHTDTMETESSAVSENIPSNLDVTEHLMEGTTAEEAKEVTAEMDEVPVSQ